MWFRIKKRALSLPLLNPVMQTSKKNKWIVYYASKEMSVFPQINTMNQFKGAELLLQVSG